MSQEVIADDEYLSTLHCDLIQRQAMAEQMMLNHNPESCQKDSANEIRSADVECRKVKGVDDKTKEDQDENKQTVAPDGGWGWMVCLGAFITNFVVFGIHNSFGVIYGTLIQEFGISSAETAWIGSLGMGLNFFFGPISSALCERIGCRLTSLAGTILAVSGLLLSSFITRKDVSKMYATYGVMWGVGSSFCYVASMVILGQYFDKRMALANGLGTSGSGFGTLIMAPVIQKLLSSLGWRSTFLCLSGAASFLFIVAWLYKPLRREGVKNEESAHPCVDLNIWRNKAFIVWVLSISFFLFGYFIPFVHLVRLAGLLGVSDSKAAWLIGYLSISSTIGRILFGKIGDLKQVNRLVMFQVSILIIGASTTLLSLAKSYTALVLYAVAFGFFDGCFVGQVAVVTSQIVGMKHLAVALGYLFGSIALPMTLGPPVAGWIYDGSKSYNVAFYVAGSTSFLGFLTMFLIPRLVKKYAEGWEKQFDSKRRASIESRRKLLSSALSDYGPDTNQMLATNGFYEIEVFPETENHEPAHGLPLTQISVDRPNVYRGRRRSLPALYISNNPSPHLTHNSSEKLRSSPAAQKISRLSGELSSATHYPGIDDRASSNNSPTPSHASGGKTSLATEQPLSNHMRGRRGSLPVISLATNLQGNVPQAENTASRMPQVLLIDANLFAQSGIPLVSVNAPPKFNRNKRRGSLPAINHPSLPTIAKPARPRTYDVGRRRGSLPVVTRPIPEVKDDVQNDREPGNKDYEESNQITKPSMLTFSSSRPREGTFEEQEEENQEIQEEIAVDNLDSNEMRLSRSSGYGTNGHVDGSASSRTSLGTEKQETNEKELSVHTFSGNVVIE